MKITFERIQKAVKGFDAACTKYSRVGASDSEPGHIFNHYARKAIETGEVVIPEKGGWDLYYDAMGCGMADRALSVAAKKVYKLLAEAPRKVTEEFKDYYGI
jgi:hypothetical protein